MTKAKKKYTHLSIHERSTILGMLQQGKSYAAIARRLHRALSTISREVKKGLQRKEGIGYSKHRDTCKRLGSRGLKVCNQCPRHFSQCLYNKNYYNLDIAIEMARARKHSAQKGIRACKRDFPVINEIVYDGVMKGQSIEYIHRFRLQDFKVSAITIRRWIYEGYMKAKPINLRRKRRFVKKYNYKPNGKYSTNITQKVGRMMDDYQDFIKNHPGAIILQTDSVEGKKTDKKRLLTLMIVAQSFQTADLYEVKGASDNVLKALVQRIRIILKYAPSDSEFALVTDNGSEFSRIIELESIFPNVHVFFADPYRSSDKAACERNHEFIRYILPKGHSLDFLTQNKVDEIMSNVNSYARKESNWKSPCERITEAYEKSLIEEMRITEIKREDVNLRSLF